MGSSLAELWRESLKLLNSGNTRRARKHLCKVLTLFPTDYVSLTNLAAVLYNEGKDEQALEYIQRAMRTEEGRKSPHTRFTNALILLKTGNWAGGWDEFEWRFAAKAAQPQGTFDRLWNGQRLGSINTLCVWGEQGLGDQIQMVRFIPKVKRMSGAEVVLVVDPSLHRIFEGLADRITSKIEATGWHYPMMSLPRMFNATPETVSGKAYLPKPEVGEYAGPKRIGFVFRSASASSEMLDRYIPDGLFQALREDAGDYRWISLQPGYEGFEPEDFFETAIRIAGCDLVITIDTSVAHLAGAMGVPVWVMLRYQGDFRWLRDRTDTPWYDSMRLYRQQKLGDWYPVISAIKKDLQDAPRACNCA